MRLHRAAFHGASVRRADADSREVSGVALPFREVLSMPTGRYRERFEPGSLRRWNDRSITLNVQHDQNRLLAGDPGALSVSFGAESVDFRATLPDTALARETLQLISSGALRGASIEFWPQESELVDGVRVIRSAVLLGIGIVAMPAYSRTSVSRRWLYGV